MYKYKILKLNKTQTKYVLEEVEGHELNGSCAATKRKDGWAIHDLKSGLLLVTGLKSLKECKQYFTDHNDEYLEKQNKESYQEFVNIKQKLDV